MVDAILQSMNPAVIYGALGVVIFICLYLLQSSSSSSSKQGAGAKKQIKQKPVGPFTVDEVANHNKEDDCWIIVDGKVYDVTDYIDEHPGGLSILNNKGGDSSVGVHGPQHPPSMWDVLALYYIGDLKK